MKIAISTDGDLVSAHFGRCPSFTIADIGENKLVNKEVVDNPGHHPGFLPRYLQDKGVEYIIAGGMGTRATGLFDEASIKTILGITGTVDEVIKQILDGTLKGGESFCSPGSGKGYGLDKTECDHPENSSKEEKKTMHGETKSTPCGKICITSQGKTLDSQVDPRFGRCQYFIVIDPESMEFEVIENSNLNAMSGAGIQSGQLIASASKGVSVVLTGNVGPNAFQTLQAAGLKIITGVDGSVKEAVARYKNKGYNHADNPTVPGHFGMKNS